LALEIVNFLILVWILKRFLYQPVMAMIARRRAAIEQKLADATARLEQGHDLERQYRERLADWKREKEQSRTTLHGELDQERARLMEQLKAELEQERERARVLEVRRTEELRRNLESEALVVSALRGTPAHAAGLGGARGAHHRDGVRGSRPAAGHAA
jgi:F-type H+-transporting ATPase subunit b